MSIFNLLKQRPRAVNHEGRKAYTNTPEHQLAALLLTSFLRGQFYRSKEDQYTDIVDLVSRVKPDFAAKAALFARNEYGMRTVSHVVAANLATSASGNEWARSFYNRIVNRPDDMLEIAALLKVLGAKNLPNAVRKGFQSAFERFDGYQLAKYRKDNAAISLVDLVNVVHPVPTRKNAKALRGLVNGTLRNTRTWEAKLSAAGQAEAKDKTKAKAEAWTELLASGKIGYFALVRNLRNILQSAPELAERAEVLLTDESRIRSSLVLPFRLFTAYKELLKVSTEASAAQRRLLGALDRAIRISFANLPAFERTLVVVDNSGSMASPAAGSLNAQCNEIGALFGLALAASSNADLMEFGTTARYISYGLGDSPMEFAATFGSKNRVGHGTDFEAIFKHIGHRSYERIVIFSDMQSGLHVSEGPVALQRYRRKSGADPWIYTFDLRGYSTSYFASGGSRVTHLAGFSEKVFNLIKGGEQDPAALVNRINAVEL